jgi:hypothetical protein
MGTCFAESHATSIKHTVIRAERVNSRAVRGAPKLNWDEHMRIRHWRIVFEDNSYVHSRPNVVQYSIRITFASCAATAAIQTVKSSVRLHFEG